MVPERTEEIVDRMDQELQRIGRIKRLRPVIRDGTFCGVQMTLEDDTFFTIERKSGPRGGDDWDNWVEISLMGVGYLILE